MGLDKYGERYPEGTVQLLHIRVQGEGGLECTFHQAVLELGNRCALLDADESWNDTLSGLRWMRTLVGGTPLPLASNPRLRMGLMDMLDELAISTSDTELARLTRKASQALEQLLASDDSPLLTACLEQLTGIGTGQRVGVLLEDGKAAPAIRKALEEAKYQPDYNIGTWASICQGPVLDRLFLFGAGEHQPTGLYKSGIARGYTRIAYAWARPEPTQGSWFRPYSGHEAGMWSNYHFETLTEGEPWYANAISPVAEEPEQGVEAEQQGWLAALPDPAEPDEMSQWISLVANERLPARRVMLSGGRAVFLGAALREGAFVLGRGSAGVHEVPVMDLAPGDWLIVPEAANRDYRRVLVDRQLGKRRDECRQRQDTWKAALARQISEEGLETVIQRLRALGCKRANSANLTNWAYGSVVCPQRQSDFEAIMTYLGKTRDYARESHRLLKMIQGASHHVADVLERELRRGLADVNPADLDGEEEYPVTLTIGNGEIEFTLVQVAGLGPIVDVERGRFGIITTN